MEIDGDFGNPNFARFCRLLVSCANIPTEIRGRNGLSPLNPMENYRAKIFSFLSLLRNSVPCPMHFGRRRVVCFCLGTRQGGAVRGNQAFGETGKLQLRAAKIYKDKGMR